MSDLRELYQEVILDHSKNPKNYRAINEASHQADGFNPLCGDKVKIYLKVEDNKIADISFEGSGCAISTASASMLTQALKGKPVNEIEAIFKKYQNLVTGNDDETNDPIDLGKLEIFAGVREFPTRVKCATLCWHTLKAALENSNQVAKTE